MLRKRDQIINELKENYIIIMDRYFNSTIAYQCAKGFDFEAAKSVVSLLKLPYPNIVIYHDLSVHESIRRKSNQKIDIDRFEKDAKYLTMVSNLYQKMRIDNFPTKNWIIVDATNDKLKQNQKIIEKLDSYLNIYNS